MEKLCQSDDGYRFLRAVRGSPPYFEKAKKDLFAMIRQLGPATLFCRSYRKKVASEFRDVQDII